MPVFATTNFRLASGAILQELEVAYDIYGTLDATAGNAVIVLHGTTSTHHAVGPATPDRRRGWGAEIVGPGRLLDTDRYCVISPNMLGSCHGSTGPSSTDPETGHPYGPAFPDITLEDMVRAQHEMLRALGIHRLVAVVGQSVGGLLAFQWAVSFPNFMAGVNTTEAGPVNLFGSAAALPELIGELGRDQCWNGGNYHDRSSLEETMTRLRVRTLRSYDFEEDLPAAIDPGEREELLHWTAREWATEFDPNSLIVLTRTLSRFDLSSQLDRIRARMFCVLTETDELYPASNAEWISADLARAGVDATLMRVESRHGHYATIREPKKWMPQAATFLASIEVGRAGR